MSCAFFDLYENFARGCPLTQTPTQKLNSEFLTFSPQEIGSSLVSLELILKIYNLSYSDKNFMHWVRKWILDFHFPGNWFEFGIILNDFGSFTIWAIQNQISLTQLQNRKNPGIQPTYVGTIMDIHNVSRELLIR